MLIIGCDYHPGFEQIAYVDSETGELQERRLKHPEEAEKFYRVGTRREGACGYGGQWACPLVRTTARGPELRVMDGRRG